MCTTGEGGAKTMKGLLEKTLIFDKNLIEIVPIKFHRKRKYI